MYTVAKLKTYRPNFSDCDINGEQYGAYVTTLSGLIRKEGGQQLYDDFWNAGIAIPGLFGAGTRGAFFESMGADWCYANITGMFQRMDEWFSKKGKEIPAINDAFLYTMMSNWGQTSLHQSLPEKYRDQADPALEEPTPYTGGYKIPPALIIVGSLVGIGLIWALLGPTIKALRE